MTISDEDFWAAQFERNRTHLRAVAYRVLGSLEEADDAVQDCWLRLTRTDPGTLENLGGWLTTVVARIALDRLRSRTRREGRALRQMSAGTGGDDATPEDEVVLADAVGLALTVVLDSLGPAERLAFVLHDMFAVPFEEIAGILERSPDSVRQLASRARRRVRLGTDGCEVDLVRQRELVHAFFAASRAGRFEELLAVLDPDAALVADGTAVGMGTPGEVRGGAAVAEFFAARGARGAVPALVNGVPGALWSVGAQVRVVFAFATAGGKITRIDLLADPARIAELDLIRTGRWRDPRA